MRARRSPASYRATSSNAASGPRRDGTASGVPGSGEQCSRTRRGSAGATTTTPGVTTTGGDGGGADGAMSDSATSTAVAWRPAMFAVAGGIAVAGRTGAEGSFWRREVREISHPVKGSTSAASTNTNVVLTDADRACSAAPAADSAPTRSAALPSRWMASSSRPDTRRHSVAVTNGSRPTSEGARYAAVVRARGRSARQAPAGPGFRFPSARGSVDSAAWRSAIVRRRRTRVGETSWRTTAVMTAACDAAALRSISARCARA